MSQTETAGRESLVIRCTDCAVVLNIGSVHVCSKRRNERMKEVGRKHDDGWSAGIGVRKYDLKSSNGGSVGTWSILTPEV
jgi:hypothetical protein